jgi:hypothetical protein
MVVNKALSLSVIVLFDRPTPKEFLKTGARSNAQFGLAARWPFQKR